MTKKMKIKGKISGVTNSWERLDVDVDLEITLPSDLNVLISEALDLATLKLHLPDKECEANDESTTK